MHPLVTVIRIGERELPIGSYGVLLCIALAVAGYGALRSARAARLDLGAVVATLGLVVAAGFAGAALLHGLVQSLRLGLAGALAAPPGLAFFGAAVASAAALIACGRAYRLPVLRIVDDCAPWLCAAHAIGRIGCLLGGCCYGSAWDGPLAIAYAHPLAPAAAPFARHPLPLYEAIGLLALALVFALRAPRDPGSGRRFFAYAAAYSALRLLLEPLRDDAVRGVFFAGALSTSQAIAALLLVAALFALAAGSENQGLPSKSRVSEANPAEGGSRLGFAQTGGRARALPRTS